MPATDDPFVQVGAFHARFGVPQPRAPSVPDARVRALRVALIREELDELAEATSREDVVGVADALADLLYVTYGAAIAWGIDIRPVFTEVHATNMAKAGGPVREDGKVLKPAGWRPPDVAGILRRQGWAG